MPRMSVTLGRLGGVPCPQCGASIVVDPRLLLGASPSTCAACGLTLQVDTGASRGALDALERYLETLARITGKAAGSVDVGTEGDGRPGRRGRPERSRRASSRSQRHRGKR